MSWCSECGAEHRPVATDCVVCGGVLVGTRPEPSSVEVDHGVMSIDIADLDGPQRSMLDLIAGSEGLHLRLVDDSAQVRTADAAAVVQADRTAAAAVSTVVPSGADRTSGRR